jgi:hypothetical protein
MGFDTAIGGVSGIWDRAPLEITAAEILPAAARL